MLKKIFYLDTRSLALLRVVVGLTFLGDILHRFGDINAFYSDRGILTRAEFLEHYGIHSKWGFLISGGEPWWVFLIFTIGVIFGIMYTKGIRTKLSAIVIWVIYMSLHNRLPVINHGGDNLTRLLFFYSIFLPVGAEYSVDKVINSKWAEVPRKYFSSWTVLLFIQAICIYWFTIWYKWHPHYKSEFSAVYYALQLEAFTTPIGYMLKDQIWLGKFLTIGTMVIEAICPVLLLIPFRQAWMRGACVAGFFALHIGIWLTFILGTFPPACIALWCAFIPSEFWDWIGTKIPRGKGMTLFYDKDCGFCRKFSLMIKEAVFLKEMEVVEAQSDTKAKQLMKQEDSWVLRINEDFYTKFSVYKQLILNSYYRPLGKLLIWEELGDAIYSYLSKKRETFGVILNKIGSSNPWHPMKWKGQIFGIIISCFVVAWNVEGTWAIKGFDIRRPFTDFVFALQLNQQWNMFAPSPMKSDGWFVFEGTMEDGKKWDVYFDEPVDKVNKPYPMRSRYRNTQWRKFLISVWYKKNSSYRKYLARWVCRNWNRNHGKGQKVDRLTIFYMKEKTPPIGQSLPKPQPVSIWNGACAR